MKINENRLKQIIREEARRVLGEQATPGGGWKTVGIEFDLDTLLFTDGGHKDTQGTISAVVKVSGDVASDELKGHVEGEVRVPCKWYYTDYTSYDHPELMVSAPKSYDMEESDFSLTLDGEPLSSVDDGLSHLYDTDFDAWFQGVLKVEIPEAFNDDGRIYELVMDELRSGAEKYPDFD